MFLKFKYIFTCQMIQLTHYNHTQDEKFQGRCDPNKVWFINNSMNHGCVFIDNVFDQFLKNSCTFEKKISCKVDKCDKMIMTCFLHKYTTNGHVKAIGA